MKKILFLLLVLTIKPISLIAADTADYKLEVQDFSSLKVTDNINVVYHCSADTAGWAYFSCEPEIARALLFTNTKSQLHIQVDYTAINTTSLPTVHIYSSNLNKVENSSDSTMIVYLNKPVQTFNARVVGNGTIMVYGLESASVDAGIATGKGHLVLNGEAGRAKISNVGTGPIEAGNLVTRNVKVILLGTGDIDCCATESISVYGAGSGKIYYAGSPQKIINRSLGVKAYAVEDFTADD